MICRSISILLVCAALLGCGSVSEKRNGAEVLNKEIYEKYQNFNSVFDEKRNKITFQSGKKATTCREYITLKNEESVDESVNNMLVKSEYLICEVLNYLSRQSKVSYKQSSEDLGKQLSDFLDLRTFPNSLSRALDENNFTLSSFYSEYIKSSHYTLVMESEDWVMSFEVVAKIYLNDNDKQDWLVQYADESKDGNYRNYATFVVIDPGDDEVLKAQL